MRNNSLFTSIPRSCCELLVGAAGLIVLAALLGSILGAFAGPAVYVFDLVQGAV